MNYKILSKINPQPPSKIVTINHESGGTIDVMLSHTTIKRAGPANINHIYGKTFPPILKEEKTGSMYDTPHEMYKYNYDSTNNRQGDLNVKTYFSPMYNYNPKEKHYFGKTIPFKSKTYESISDVNKINVGKYGNVYQF